MKKKEKETIATVTINKLQNNTKKKNIYVKTSLFQVNTKQLHI